MLRGFCRPLGLFGLPLALTLLTAPARAQDLEAGKTPPQLFASSCSACHKSPQGLAKGRSAGAVAGFLAQHYTTGRKPAADLAGYLVAVGEGPKSAREREPRRNARGEARERTAAVHAEEAPPSRAEQKAEERRARRAEERKEKEKERKAHEPRATDRPPGLEWVPRRDARSRRGRHGQEPVSVWSDPDPVIVSREPVPLFHDRALSRVHDERQARTHEERAPQPQPAASAPAAPPPAAPPPAAVAAVAPSGGAAPAPQPEAAAPVPAAPAAPAPAAPAEAPAAAAQPAAGAAAAAQPFAAPLP